MRIVLIFETTHQALWAEEVALEGGIPVEMVPAPPEAHARCNLALEVEPREMARLETALREAGVEYRVW